MRGGGLDRKGRRGDMSRDFQDFGPNYPKIIDKLFNPSTTLSLNTQRKI